MFLHQFCSQGAEFNGGGGGTFLIEFRLGAWGQGKLSNTVFDV